VRRRERFMWEATELHCQIIMVVSHVVEADQVRDAGGRNGCLESIGLGDQPVRQLPAVTPAFYTQTRGIEPWVLGQCRIDSGEHVLCLAAVLVLKDGIGELLAVSSRTAIVDHERREAMCGVDLRFLIEAWSLLAV